MSKKFFISQPMNGLSDEQVLQERAAVIGKQRPCLVTMRFLWKRSLRTLAPMRSRWIIWHAASSFWLRLTWRFSPRAGSTHAAAALSGSAPRNTVFR